MQIDSIEAIPIAATFRSTFRFGTTDRSTSPNVVLILRTNDGHVGYGEAVPVPAFTSETQRSIVELVESRVEPVVLGRNPLDRRPILADLHRVLRFAPFTVAALDTALHDLVGRALGVPVHALLGGSFRDRTPVHGSVGWEEEIAPMVDLAVEQAQTYRSLKLYAGRDTVDRDLDRLQAIRDAVGPDIELFVDVNTMWTPSDLIRALPRVREIGLRGLEQPLPVQSSELQNQLLAGHDVDLIADEAVRTVADAARVALQHSATVMNVGHSKLGGLSAAVQAAQVAHAHGIGLHVGSVIEMGIATAAGLHLAASLPSLAYPSYLMGPLKYAQQLTDEQIEVVDSAIAIPQGPGLGVTIVESELRRLDARAQV